MPPHCRVLIVDDDVEWLGIVADLLRDAGYSVVTAEDGRRASQMIAELEPFVVVTDLRMPVMSGDQLLAETHAADGRLPVIVVSGDVAADAAALPGAFRVIRKPSTPEGLLAAVADAAAHRVERLPLQKLWRAAPTRAAVVKRRSPLGALVSAAVSYITALPRRRLVLAAAVLGSALLVRQLTKAT